MDAELKGFTTRNLWPGIINAHSVDMVFGPDAVAIIAGDQQLLIKGDVSQFDSLRQRASDGLSIAGRTIALPEWMARDMGVDTGAALENDEPPAPMPEAEPEAEKMKPTTDEEAKDEASTPEADQSEEEAPKTARRLRTASK